jgi:HD-GYP domain-containing protein (c-di-GMP phosphodiesterase class II)
LQSSQRLSVAQWQHMKAHPVAGRQLLSGTPLEELGFILEQHHERLDGSGYPHGLKEDALSLEASVVAVADTFDAITHARPYQDARSAQHALSEINRYSDVLYPSAVVSALNRVVRSVQD